MTTRNRFMGYASEENRRQYNSHGYTDVHYLGGEHSIVRIIDGGSTVTLDAILEFARQTDA